MICGTSYIVIRGGVYILGIFKKVLGTKKVSWVIVSVQSTLLLMTKAKMASILYGMEVALKELLARVAADYGLDYDEMEARYMDMDGADVSMESVARSPPKKAPKAAVATKSGEKVVCKGVTTKGAACKKMAVAGGCYCAVHAPKVVPVTPPVPVVSSPPGSPVAGSSPECPPAPKKAPKAVKKAVVKKVVKKTKKGKKVEPKHSHPVDEEMHPECEGCEAHGVPTDPKSPEYAVRGSVRTRLSEMLKKVAAMEEEVVDESDRESVAGAAVEIEEVEDEEGGW